MVKKYNHHANHGTVPNDKANILGRDFEAETIHQKWCTDITYIHVLKEGWTGSGGSKKCLSECEEHAGNPRP